ncbi:tyrosine-type recombinase/integrase [Desulfocicer niacini]
MAKEKWETVYRGIKVKKHPTRKHGIKPDLYFTARFQFNGKRINSGLGWASEGWTLDKAIVRMNELKDEAKTGAGGATHRKKQVEADEHRKEQECLEKEQQEQEAKDSMNLEVFFKSIYYPAIQTEKKEKTHATEEQLFRLWIKPTIGEKPFKDITTFDIERLKKAMLDAGKSLRTLEYALTTLGQIFRYAESTGHHVGDIPTSKVKKPKYDNKRVRFLSLEEAHHLLDLLKVMSPQVHNMALVSLHCGLRAGELFSLTWGAVDMEHGLITLLDTKSGKTRTLSMTDDVKNSLAAMGPSSNGELVFPARTGGKIKIMSNSFRNAVQKAGFNNGITDRRQRVTFHTLRHTFASWLVMEGISLYEVKELLGHASLTMTERYSHLAPDRNRRAADTLGAIFQKADPVKNGDVLGLKDIMNQ